MKIKLVTFAPRANFGTCLQSYALNKVLKDMGHDVEFIYNGRERRGPGLRDLFKKVILFVLPQSIIRNIQVKRSEMPSVTSSTSAPFILKLPNNYCYYLISKLPFFQVLYKFLCCNTLQKRKVYSFTFEDGNFNMKRAYIRRQYNKITQDADMFVTGSDQIWNPYCGGFNPLMFLEIAGDKKRIAYSSSIARLEFPIEVRERAKIDLQKFLHIGVREQSSADMLNSLLSRNDVSVVVDPTFLLTVEEWTKFANRAHLEFKLPDQYIFCYFIGGRIRDYIDMVEDVKRETGISDVITIDCTNRYVNYGGGLLYKDGGPYEFVYLLSHAAMVCMDSFHATVFSLIFKKNFVHILKSKEDNSDFSQNSRMYDLFSRYNITYKLYNSNSNNWLNPVDYKDLGGKLSEDISTSICFLKNAIEQ